MSSAPERLLFLHTKARGLPEPEPEVRFAPPRRFRFDFAWERQKLAVEVNGGGWTRGRHHRPQGHANDCVKLNLAQELGWRVLQFVPEQIESGEAVNQIERMLRGRAT